MRRRALTWAQIWRRRSLRFWFVAGMGLSLGPLVASAVFGYILLDRAVIHPFDDVVTTQQTVLEPVQNLRLMLWETAMPVNDYLIRGAPDEVSLYHQLRAELEGAFARLEPAIAGYGHAPDLLVSARRNWDAATVIAGQLLALPNPVGASDAGQEMEDFDRLVALATQDLSALYQYVRGDSLARRDTALEAHRISTFVAGGAFAMSVLFVLFGVLLINRMLVSNIGKLAEASHRFALGERDLSLDIKAPPELRTVSKEFNGMVARIAKQEQAMTRSANTDALTGLLNRRAFNRVLAEELSRSDRYGGTVALMMVDIDNFKQLNDSHGHLAGDKALCCIAGILSENARDSDVVCRYGGEEFALVLPSTESVPAAALGQRLRARVAEAGIDIGGGRRVSLTISVGLAVCPHSATAPAALVQEADEALYESKSQGRNRVTVASSARRGPHGAPRQLKAVR